MRNRMYGGVRGRKTKVGEKLLRFPPTRFMKFCFLTAQLFPTDYAAPFIFLVLDFVNVYRFKIKKADQ